MTDFFISFNRNDRIWAAWIAWTLVDAKYSVIFQDWDFRPGHNFADEMDKALRTSDRVIAVLSQTYLDSAYARSEWLAAFTKDPTGVEGKLVPVKVGACQADGLLAPLIRIDLIGKREKAAKDELLKGLKPSGRPEQSPPFPGESDPQQEPESVQPHPVQEGQEPDVAEPPPVLPEPPPALPERPPALPERPRLFPGLQTILIRRAIAAVLVLIVALAGWYGFFLVKYHSQTKELGKLVIKTDSELSDAESRRMKELAQSLYNIQQKIGFQSEWPETYLSLCGWPHITDMIPPPEGTRCP